MKIIYPPFAEHAYKVLNATGYHISKAETFNKLVQHGWIDASGNPTIKALRDGVAKLKLRYRP